MGKLMRENVRRMQTKLVSSTTVVVVGVWMVPKGIRISLRTCFCFFSSESRLLGGLNPDLLK